LRQDGCHAREAAHAPCFDGLDLIDIIEVKDRDDGRELRGRLWLRAQTRQQPQNGEKDQRGQPARHRHNGILPPSSQFRNRRIRSRQ
jgi:hypothetical protein